MMSKREANAKDLEKILTKDLGVNNPLFSSDHIT